MERLRECSICGDNFHLDSRGFGGHNAKPVVHCGVCCDACNTDVVIPYRIMLINKEGK